MEVLEKRQGLHLACFGITNVESKRDLVALTAKMGFNCESQVRQLPGQPKVLTGHAAGLITLNIEEADDSIRELHRETLREPYRTLLGHLRHETGHYYWDRLVRNSPPLAVFRAAFGDETKDYARSLESYRQSGPPPDWRERFVSAYASAHPWEDWAETWAHYLHLLDTLDTAASFGIGVGCIETTFERFGPDSLLNRNDPSAGPFLDLVNGWGRFTLALNELSRSMGLPDFYPFVLSREAVAKLHVVHCIVEGASVVERDDLAGQFC